MAATRLKGVTQITTSAMRASTYSMNDSVPMMVITPVKSWLKPISRPSAKVSTSAIMRLTRSPEECASR